MKRGDLITVALAGDYGKPRPAVIVQSNSYRHLYSVTVLLLTSTIDSREMCRVVILPSIENGLRETSQVMVEKAATLPRTKAGRRIGQLSAGDMANVDRELAAFLGFA